MAAAVDGDAQSAGSSAGCGLPPLGRLLRKLRIRQSKVLPCTPAGAGAAGASSRRRCQYDPLSYARNFDPAAPLDGDGDDDVSHYHRTFASRFVLAASDRRPQ